MSSFRQTRRLAAPVLVAGLALAWIGTSSPWAQGDCSATLSISQARAEPDRVNTKYIYKIDVSVPNQCAVVEFNVLLDVEAPGGQVTQHKKYRKTKLRTRHNTYSYTYETSQNNKILKYEVQQISCNRCE